MAYTKKQFLEDVAKEATALKEHATKDELNDLNFEHLDPNHHGLCIYGQMTGNCTSERASHLIFNCCKRFFVSGSNFRPDIGFKNARKSVNGEKINGIGTVEELHKDRRGMEHFSSLEAYIMLPEAENESLISFLKGEREDLKL